MASKSKSKFHHGQRVRVIKAFELGEFRETLRGRDLWIFDRRLVAEEPLTHRQLGDQFGVSRERVRQLEVRLIGKLRAFLRSQLGEADQLRATGLFPR